MTDFQYLYITSIIRDLRAEGYVLPDWDSRLWIKLKDEPTKVKMYYLGEFLVASIEVPRTSDGTEIYSVGAVAWEKVESELR